jgi:hypothetical protein
MITRAGAPRLRRVVLGPLVAGCALAGCAGGMAADRPQTRDISHDGVQTRLLDADLVNFRVEMSGAVTPDDLNAYARCAAAQYAQIRGFGFARHVRTQMQERAGVWSADTVYTISPALPRGLQTLDAEVVVAACADQGIPTV